MEALSLDAFLRGLKHGAPHPVYYLSGTEDVLKDEAIRALLDRAVEAETRAFNLDQRRAADLDPEELDTLLNTPPMLAACRVVVLRGLEELKRGSGLHKALLTYLAAPNPTTVLVLVQGAGEPPDGEIARLATAVALGPLPGNRVVRWLAHRAATLGATLEPDASALLLDAAGSDLQQLATELEKLAGLAAGRAITAADVTAAVGVRRGETAKDLVAAVLEHRTPDAVGLVDPVLRQSGMTGVRVVSLLGAALVGTGVARAELDRGVSAPRLVSVLVGHMRQARLFGVSYQEEAERWAAWAPGWSEERLRSALRCTLGTDTALKSTALSDERGLLVTLLLEIGVVAGTALGAAA